MNGNEYCSTDVAVAVLAVGDVHGLLLVDHLCTVSTAMDPGWNLEVPHTPLQEVQRGDLQ